MHQLPNTSFCRTHGGQEQWASTRSPTLRTAACRILTLLATCLAAGLYYAPQGHELHRTILVPRNETYRCPKRNVSYSVPRLNYTCPREVTICESLGLAFVHVYKSAGTSLVRQLQLFCRESTGTEAVVYSGWADGVAGAQRPCNMDAVCNSGLTCYSLVRDPIDRFLSAYHEIMRRNPDRDPELKLEPTATDEEKLSSFRLALSYRETRKITDGHMNSQVEFLPKKAPFILFSGRTAASQIQTLLCRAHACFHNGSQTAPRCPDAPIGAERSRADTNYRLPQYMISESDLSDSEIARIAKIYTKDYCRLGLKKHPRAGDVEFECGEGGGGVTMVQMKRIE